MGRKATGVQALLSRTVVGPKGCWLWTGAVSSTGYGWASLHGRTWRAHRLAYLLAVGDIPAGKFVLHKCDERRCINPGHLYLGDQDANMADMVMKGRQNRGESVNTAKLTRAEASEVKRLHKAGRSVRSLSHRFGVTRRAIQLIVTGRNWRSAP